MDSLLGRSILAAFPRSQTGIESADSVPRHFVVKASNSQQPAPTSSSSSPSSTNSATLPLCSRSLLPGPLKFLWFSKNQEEIQAGDPFAVSESLESGSASSELLAGSDGTASSKSWGPNIWGLRSWIGRTQEISPESCEGNIQEENIAQLERENVDEAEEAQPCPECEMDGTDGCLISSVLEVPHVQISHTRESFSRFLRPMTLPETRAIARMSHLCNLAYRVRDIKPSNLLQTFGLEYVTSSLDKKEEALAKDTASSSKSDESDGARFKQRFPITPASAYSLASAVASYLHSHTKSLLHHKKNSADDDATEASQECDSEKSGELHAEEEEAEDYESSEMATLIASSPVTAVVAAKEGTKDAVAKDLQSLHNCPCEWYCCDDKSSLTRHFVIQGSESLASWQANLLFEPTHFEDSSLGVLVHRGIYEAAKGLYEQLLPCVLEHLHDHGDQARLCFTGHSLGGSLATLVSLMLQIRGVVQREALLPVLTFGSPCILCGGDYLLDKLGLPKDHICSVMLHRDIVPRTFACSYPDHVAEILKRLNGNFRDHPCLNNQRLLYAPMGQFIILQPSEDDAPPHPLVPPGLGLYVVRHPEEGPENEKETRKVEVRAAQRAFLNSPHPLEILSDPGAYGSEGSISRDHDPRSYMRSITDVVRQEARKTRRLRWQQRRRLWWPLLTAELSSVFAEGGGGGGSSGSSGGGQEMEAAIARSKAAPPAAEKLYAGVIDRLHHRQAQVALVFFLSAKLALMQGFATFFAWV